MKNIFDFIQAALPWMAMGLLLAIFFARSASKKRKDENKTDNYGLEGMCFGMCMGTAIGASMGNGTGIGMSLGMLIGLVIGTCIKKENGEKSNNEK